MPAIIIGGPESWEGDIDDDGYRTYKLVYKVEAHPSEGPATVLQTPGLPAVGTRWLVDADTDIWAWCRPQRSAKPEVSGEPNRHWKVELTFSNKPPDKNSQRQGCHDKKIDNPLLEPQKVSGSFTRDKEEATKDRFGKPVVNSAHEQIRGPTVEFDVMRPNVKIEQNVALLDLPLLSRMKNTVNDRPLWGMPARTIRLSGISWDKLYYGTCFVYYKRSFEFEVNEETFDRDVLDEGTKVLSGAWDLDTNVWEVDEIAGRPADPKNPAHFIRYKDRNNENTRVILDGAGKPYNPDVPVHQDCPQCGDGSPDRWQVSGFKGSLKHLNVILLHQGACNWSGDAPNGDTVSLTYDAGDGFWVLGSNKTGATLWTTDNDVWSCQLENTMLRTLIGNGPDTIKVLPYGGTSPGSKKIEKYGQSNFLLLGIPVVL
jgi:hypothetical protein